MASKKVSEAATAASGARTKDAPGARVAPGAEKARYVKRAIMEGSRFRRYRDVLSVLLVEGKEYAIDEVEGMIEEYLREGVSPTRPEYSGEAATQGRSLRRVRREGVSPTSESNCLQLLSVASTADRQGWPETGQAE